MKTYLKKNKALLILPLVLLPFVVLIFYILGGGEKASQNQNQTGHSSNEKGANYLLPEAEKSIEIFDKMEAYQKQNLAVRSGTQNPSVESSESSNDTDLDLTDVNTDSLKALLQHQVKADVSGQLLAHIKQKEELVREDLEKELSEKESSSNRKIKKDKAPVLHKKEKKSLQRMMEDQQSGFEELEQVIDENSSLNRENDSLKYYLQQAQEKLSDLNQKKRMSFSLEKKQRVGFNGKTPSNSMIKAEIYETTTVLNGNRIKMRLLEDAWIDGKKAGKNTFFYGICKINNERLNIEVLSFPLAQNFLPVELQVHDLDGLPGLYIPGNAARKVSKEIGSRTNTSALWSMSTDPLTGIGINTADRTAQALIKRVRLKKITIKKNSLVYLINQNQQP
ncbi:hypothetical protein BZG01_17780 [Labilibaculum manganireducens]|uniref:Conjugative transposon TraM C-terminal domain-containing protein n=1 Tax=Labilibaculum manganireducens TaxID=1940525 RepID=A0A2N3HVT9_9BACT|nr:conjugative transposon protein TraM [Labilibaculum manganireducens]PKQ62169.1 hypothetical protein BZG01_17780 [Labilibaculum manganireducens]